jgi:hypothetical protein
MGVGLRLIGMLWVRGVIGMSNPNDWFNRFGPGSAQQGGGKGNAGQGQGVRQDTLSRENVVNIDGRDFVDFVDVDEASVGGGFVRRVKQNLVKVADGRFVSVTEIVGVSWGGLHVPKDREGYCVDSFGHHLDVGDNPRPLVFLGVDGFVTELGNVLCTPCFVFNKGRAAWRKRFGWCFLYHKEVF